MYFDKYKNFMTKSKLAIILEYVILFDFADHNIDSRSKFLIHIGLEKWHKISFMKHPDFSF